MEHNYELVKTDIGVPIKVFIHSVNKLKMHWHKQLEILLVLEGSISIGIGDDEYLLKENDLILINSNEIHNTTKTNEDNIILGLQIDTQHYERYFHGFSKRIFDCKSFMCDESEQERFDTIRQQLAKIVWELNKRKRGHSFKIGSELLLLAERLLNNFHNQILEEDKVEALRRDIYRLSSIISYIDENFDKGVTLQNVADNENLSVYYLSHYIKKALGITFQEYLNTIRLEKAIVLLARTDKTITDVALESGFPSTKSLNNLFRNVYNSTPSQFRKENKNKAKNVYNLSPDEEEIRSKSYFDVDRTAAFSKLFTYLKPNLSEERHICSIAKEFISVDANNSGTHHNFYWKKLIAFGRASEGLRKGWQNQLEELQSEIGFEYIRCHGIFSDEMMVCNIGDDGNIIYNWSYVDELFDFFKEVNIKPFVELGFMPSEIKKSDETIFNWKANISQPKDIKLWTDLVKEFIKHCVNRYGLKEVETWYFEVWNEPDLEHVFWIGGKEEYFEFYKETAIAIKSVSDKLKAGGPSIIHQVLEEQTWLEDFLIYCKENKAPLDFVSLHIYPETFALEEETQDLMIKSKEGEDYSTLMSLWGQMKKIYFDQEHTYDTINDAQNKINTHLLYEPEVHITEWSSSSYGRNFINDTCYVSNFIIRNVLKSIGTVDSLGYWTFTDIMEEFKAGISHFHGGFGLINKEGLKKPSYFAYYLLSKLGDMIIEQGEEYIVTKDGDDIQILAYNFAYFDELFMSGDTSALTNTERYLVYEDKSLKEVEVNIVGLSGHHKITRYQLNRDHGSVFDEWLKMGNPENMTQEEINYLKGKAYPGITIEYVDIDVKYTQSLSIPVHGVELIILEKQV